MGKLTNTVEDNNRVVDGEGKYGKNGGDKKKVNLYPKKVPEKTETPQKNDRVVKHGNKGANTVFELFEGEADIEKKHYTGDNQRADSLFDGFFSESGTNTFETGNFDFGVVFF